MSGRGSDVIITVSSMSLTTPKRTDSAMISIGATAGRPSLGRIVASCRPGGNPWSMTTVST